MFGLKFKMYYFYSVETVKPNKNSIQNITLFKTLLCFTLQDTKSNNNFFKNTLFIILNKQ